MNIDSGSYNKAGVDRAGDAICRFFDAQAIGYDIIPNDKFGNAIRATLGPPGDRRILLMGHRDTVYPDGEASRRPFRVEGPHGFGPGVADMKAGLVMNCFVAAALKKFAAAPAPVDRAVHRRRGDRLAILARAHRGRGAARARWCSTPSRAGRGNAVVTGRKAGIFMRFAVTGKAAHAGANFEQGSARSARWRIRSWRCTR